MMDENNTKPGTSLRNFRTVGVKERAKTVPERGKNRHKGIKK